MIDTEDKKHFLKPFQFIDLFAGIGGFHYALKSFGASCVFASEIDKKAATVYQNNHNILPKGDITKIAANEIPKHDILCAGFPCQAFSISGKQKGFEDTRGILFFDIARIIKHHKPKILFLENVKNLIKHDKEKTLKVIKDILEELNYTIFYKVLNTSNFGLPQNRERVYIIGFNNSEYDTIEFHFPITKIFSSLETILDSNPKDAKVIERPDILFYKKYQPIKNIFGEIELPNKPFQIGKVNKGGQGERIYHPKGHAITLSAYGGGVGSKTGLYKIKNKIRKLSPRECARLQGFPETFKFHKSVSEAQKQFGNSVSINVLQFIVLEIIKTIENDRKSKKGITNSKKRVSKRKRYCKQI